MELEFILELERWANSIDQFSTSENLIDAAIYMRKAIECMKNEYYSNMKKDRTFYSFDTIPS